jgi:hypothetical protein
VFPKVPREHEGGAFRLGGAAGSLATVSWWIGYHGLNFRGPLIFNISCHALGILENAMPCRVLHNGSTLYSHNGATYRHTFQLGDFFSLFVIQHEALQLLLFLLALNLSGECMRCKD